MKDKRIEAFLSNRIAPGLNFGKKPRLAAAGMLAVLFIVSLAKAQEAPPAFEVASVKQQHFLWVHTQALEFNDPVSALSLRLIRQQIHR